MNRHGLIFLILAFLTACAGNNAKEAKNILVEGTLENTPRELVEYCKTAPCRKNTYFKVKLKDGSHYEYKGILDPPVVQSDFVTLYPGEEVFIEADINGDRLVNLLAVPKIENPEKTISIKFWQELSMRDGTEMMLRVQNPFDKFLRYELAIMTFDSEDLQYTSSCPVMPGKLVYEHWPYPIFQIAFANMRFISVEGNKVGCK